MAVTVKNPNPHPSVISKAKGAKHCLFLPRFVCVRDDKLHADTLDIIQSKGAK